MDRVFISEDAVNQSVLAKESILLLGKSVFIGKTLFIESVLSKPFDRSESERLAGPGLTNR